MSDELLELKIAALRAHNSQTAGLIDLVGPAAYREWWRTESFRNADPPTNRGGHGNCLYTPQAVA